MGLLNSLYDANSRRLAQASDADALNTMAADLGERARAISDEFRLKIPNYDEFSRSVPPEAPKSFISRLAKGLFQATLFVGAVVAAAVGVGYLAGASFSGALETHQMARFLAAGASVVGLGVLNAVNADNSVQVKSDHITKYAEYLDGVETELTLSKQNQKDRGVEVQVVAPARSATHFRDMIVNQESVKLPILRS